MTREDCDDLLSVLAGAPGSTDFLNAVDPVALGLQDYFAMVTEPINFSSIQEKLKSTKYSSIGGFASDIHLSIANAAKYNPRRKHVHNSAKELRVLFAKELQNFIKDAMPFWSSLYLTAPRSAHRLLHVLAREPEFVFFPKPADTAALSTSCDYNCVLTRPTELETICGKVNSSPCEFLMSEALINDFRLVFFNAMTYNPSKAHTITLAAKKLLAIFETCVATTASGAVASAPPTAVTCRTVSNFVAKIVFQGVVDKIYAATESYFFRKPANPVAENLNPNLKIIEQPMDIETLSCHVTYGAVNTFEGLQLELDLIVIHATVNYPNPTSVINAAVVVFNKLATQAIFSARTTTRHPLAMSSATTQPRPVSNTLLFDTLSLSQGEMCQILDVLRRKRPASEFFLRPIDNSVLGLEDYPRAFNLPADLTTIEGQLKTYKTFTAFVHDIRSVFDNARTYVPDPSLTVHRSAEALSRVFEGKLNKLVSAPSKEEHKCKITEKRQSVAGQVATMSTPFGQRTFPLLYPTDAFPKDPSNPLCITMSSSWRNPANPLAINVHRPVDTQTKASSLLDMLWYASRSESLSRRGATTCDLAAHQQHVLEAADRKARQRKERIAELERDCEARRILHTKTCEKDLRLQREHGEARQHARETARRQREKLGQTVDLDQQRITVASFLEHTTGPSASSGYKGQ